MSTHIARSNATGLKVQVQKLGRFLSGMLMPNIGAFIAWGLFSALFLPAGWLPNEDLAKLAAPVITYLLPVLIGYSGGQMIHGTRGGSIGALAAAGAAAGTETPMILGAMIAGPLSAWTAKQFDNVTQRNARSGSKTSDNHISAVIIGAAFALFAYAVIGPVVQALIHAMSAGTGYLVEADLLPFAHIIIEPAKILFLNNALNHGIINPVGFEQAANHGQSILFLIESNPGPGLGVLLAFSFFGRGTAKKSAPGAAVVQFFGGVHEVYFPFVLMKPWLLSAVIAGGATGTYVFSMLQTGLVSTPSPGSILSYLVLSPKGEFIPVVSGVLAAAAVSFLLASLLLKISKQDKLELNQAADNGHADEKGTQPNSK